MTIAADLLLLAIDPELRRVRSRDKINYALMGADLVELAIAERVTVLDERIHVTDQRPTGDQCLDAALASLASAPKPPRAKTWVQAVRGGLRAEYLAVLENEGAISSQLRPFLRVFAKTELSVMDTGRRADIKARIDAIAAGGQPRDARDRALAGLTHACGLDATLLFPGAANRDFRKRLKEVAKHDGISADVIEATRSAADAAIDAATDAAVHAATSAAVDAAHHAGYSGHDGGGGGGGHH